MPTPLLQLPFFCYSLTVTFDHCKYFHVTLLLMFDLSFFVFFIVFFVPPRLAFYLLLRSIKVYTKKNALMEPIV